jgi:hypothetical protein
LFYIFMSATDPVFTYDVFAFTLWREDFFKLFNFF